jgi:hypothetical protein
MNTIIRRATVFVKCKQYMTRENFKETVKIAEFQVEIRKRHVLNTWLGVATVQAYCVFAYVFRIGQNFIRYMSLNDYNLTTTITITTN